MAAEELAGRHHIGLAGAERRGDQTDPPGREVVEMAGDHRPQQHGRHTLCLERSQLPQAAEQAAVVQLGHQIRDEPAVASGDQGPGLGLQQLGGARPVWQDRAVVVHARRTARPAAHLVVAGRAVRIGQQPPAPGSLRPVGPFQRRIGGQLPLNQLLEFGQRQGQHLGEGEERRRHLQVESCDVPRARRMVEPRKITCGGNGTPAAP